MESFRPYLTRSTHSSSGAAWICASFGPVWLRCVIVVSRVAKALSQKAPQGQGPLRGWLCKVPKGYRLILRRC